MSLRFSMKKLWWLSPVCKHVVRRSARVTTISDPEVDREPHPVVVIEPNCGDPRCRVELVDLPRSERPDARVSSPDRKSSAPALPSGPGARAKTFGRSRRRKRLVSGASGHSAAASVQHTEV